MMECRSSLAFVIIALRRFAKTLHHQSLTQTKGSSNLVFIQYLEELIWRKEVDHCEIFNSELSLWNWNGNWKRCVCISLFDVSSRSRQTFPPWPDVCLRVIRLNEPKIQLRLKERSTVTFGLLRNYFCSHFPNYPRCKSKVAPANVWKDPSVLTSRLSLCALLRTDARKLQISGFSAEMYGLDC